MTLRLFLLALSVSLTSATPSHADDSNQRLEAVQSEIKQLSDSVKQSKKSREKLNKQLKQQSQSIAKLTSSLHSLKQNLTQKRQDLERLESEQQQYLENHAEQLSALNTQLRSAFINAQPSYLKIILSQQDPSKLSRSGTYFKYFHQARQQQLSEINHSLQAINHQQRALVEAQQQLQQLQTEQQQQYALLKQQNQKQLHTVKELNNDLRAKSERISELRDEEKALRDLLTSLIKQEPITKPNKAIKQHRRFAKNKGALVWPVNGKVLARYGSSRKLGKLTWQGIMIEADNGEHIIAPATGTVVFSDWLRGFGLLLIIDHGDKYMTLYGNNQTLLKEVGEKVSAGDIIALSGGKGIRQFAGLYFELRHKGNPTNPARWLSKRS